MNRPAFVAGTGLTRFGKFPDESAESLGREAVLEAFREAQLMPPQSVDAVYCGSVYSGMMTGQRVCRDLGLTGIPIFNVENACSSSATALHLAIQAITSGTIDNALVIGVEQLTQFGGGYLPLAKDDFEVQVGMRMPALYAMRAQRCMYELGYELRDLAAVSVKSRAHGALNPLAQFTKAVTLEEVLASRMVAPPLTLFQCCPGGDGAAALIVSSEANAALPPVRFAASCLQTGRVEAGGKDLTRSEVTERTAKLAYEEASMEPQDIDVAEIHDAFTIAELMYYEALGFAERGGGPRLLHDGTTRLDGSIVVNPSGGLLSRGHPVGATGAAQVVEIARQLQGRSGKHQVGNANRGLAHATGGGIAGLDHGACTIHILERRGKS